MRTVGKNLAQAVLMLSDGSGLFFSVREFFTPKGQSMAQGHQPPVTLRDLGVKPEALWTNVWKMLQGSMFFSRDDVDSWSSAYQMVESIRGLHFDTETQRWTTSTED